MRIIVFDEIDAICKHRGSVRDGSAVLDTTPNQLLTRVDGVDSLNNTLLFGMANPKVFLGEALLRPWRLDVHIGAGLRYQSGSVRSCASTPPSCPSTRSWTGA
ncbi:unnamed protein product [Ostreobium quekettii]|uniref:Vesicle-fusing ATPase n=1 Tax=Ostreobium quekettii TaxID=121088 RepID=A0A8S1J5Y7_9CHLO|nr:unnamed protein product [Ostreobium quekettii]|eukprot:evm.model.scf_640.2 EVM.evm.TU.scf_640.2   scf_640:25614-25922(-)